MRDNPEKACGAGKKGLQTELAVVKQLQTSVNKMVSVRSNITIGINQNLSLDSKLW